MRNIIVRIASFAVLSLPPVKGLGLVLEYASRIFSGWNIEIPVRIHGSLVMANASIRDGRRLMFTARYHDRDERAFVRSVLRPGDYAVDVGANIGLYTLLFSKLVGPRGHVTAIEAEPANAQSLSRNIDLNGYSNVTVHQKGASDKHETLALHLSQTNLGMHSFVANEGHGDVSIECEPLGHLLTDHKPKLLKIDVEGFEFRVLSRYFADISADLRPQFIMLEDWSALRQGDVVGSCVAHGYRIVRRSGPNLMFEQV